MKSVYCRSLLYLSLIALCLSRDTSLLYAVQYSPQALARFSLSQVQTLLKRAIETNDTELIQQLKTRLVQLQQAEGIVLKGVNKNDIFIRDAQGRLKSLEGQELQVAQANLAPLPKGIPVPTTPPAGFGVGDGHWQWLKKGEKVVWVADKSGAVQVTTDQDGDTVVAQFKPGAVAPAQSTDAQTIAQLRAQIKTLESNLALAKVHKPGDVVPLSPGGKPVGLSPKEQQALKARVTVLPPNVPEPTVEGFKKEDGFWGWDPVAKQAVFVLAKPGEFSQEHFKPTGPAVEQEALQIPPAPPLEGEPEGIPPASEGAVPEAPPLEGGEVPEAPPIDGDIPEAPALDIPEAPGIPEAPVMEGLEEVEAPVEQPSEEVVAKPLTQAQLDAKKQDEKRASDAIFLEFLKRINDLELKGLVVESYLKKIDELATTLLSKNKQFFYGPQFKKALHELRTWLGQSGDTQRYLQGIENDKTRTTTLRMYQPTITKQLEPAIEHIALLLNECLFDKKSNASALFDLSTEFVERLRELYRAQHPLSDAAFVRAFCQAVTVYPPVDKLTKQEYIKQVMAMSKTLQNSGFLLQEKLAEALKSIKNFAESQTPSAIIALSDDAVREARYVQAVRELMTELNQCLFVPQDQRDTLTRCVQLFVTSLIGLSRSPVKAEYLDQIQSDELLTEKICKARNVAELSDLLTSLLRYPKFLKFNALMRNSLSVKELGQGIEQLKAMAKAPAMTLLKTPSVAKKQNKPSFLEAIKRDLLFFQEGEDLAAISECLDTVLSAHVGVVSPAERMQEEVFDANDFIVTELPKLKVLTDVAKVVKVLAEKASDKHTKEMLKNFAIVVSKYPDQLYPAFPDLYEYMMKGDSFVDFAKQVEAALQTASGAIGSQATISTEVKEWMKAVVAMSKADAATWTPLNALTPTMRMNIRKKIDELVKKAMTALTVVRLFNPLIVLSVTQGDVSNRLINVLIQTTLNEDLDTKALWVLINKITPIIRRVDDIFLYLQSTIMKPLGSLQETPFGGLKKDKLSGMIQEYNLLLDILNTVLAKEGLDTFVLTLRSLNAGKKAIANDKDIFALYSPKDADTYSRYEGKLQKIVDAVQLRDFQAIRASIIEFFSKPGLGFEKDHLFLAALQNTLDFFQKETLTHLKSKIIDVNIGNKIDIPGLEAKKGTALIQARNRAFLGSLRGKLTSLVEFVQAIKTPEQFNSKRYIEEVFKLYVVNGTLDTVLQSMKDELFGVNASDRVYQEWQMGIALLGYFADIGIGLQQLKLLAEQKETLPAIPPSRPTDESQLLSSIATKFHALAELGSPELPKATSESLSMLYPEFKRAVIQKEIRAYQEALAHMSYELINPYSDNASSMQSLLLDNAILVYMKKKKLAREERANTVFGAMVQDITPKITKDVDVTSEQFTVTVIKPAFTRAINSILPSFWADIVRLNEGQEVVIEGLSLQADPSHHINDEVVARNREFFEKLKGQFTSLLKQLNTVKKIQDFNLDTYVKSVYALYEANGSLSEIFGSMSSRGFSDTQRVWQEWEMGLSLLTYLMNIGVQLEGFKPGKNTLRIQELTAQLGRTYQSASRFEYSKEFMAPLIAWSSVSYENDGQKALEFLKNHARRMKDGLIILRKSIESQESLQAQRNQVLELYKILNPSQDLGDRQMPQRRKKPKSS